MPDALRICLTGGGTAGHVMPHLALLPWMQARGHNVFYVGSSGIEREIVTPTGLEFHEIPAGKLRRYFSWENLTDLFRVAAGFFKALTILRQQRPDVVFSKGGFVSVPVVVAAACLRIPVVSHESDLTPGLATRINQRFSKTVLYTFPDTGTFLPKNGQWAGTPVRDSLKQGDAERAVGRCGFSGDDQAPVLLIMGGSQGAGRINELVEEALPTLLERYRIIHLTGAGKGLSFSHARYKGQEFAGDELADYLALADFVVSRAGANSLFEFLTLKKPMLLIPLELGSRGDQLDNARSFQNKGWAMVEPESSLTAERLISRLAEVEASADTIRQAQSQYTGDTVVDRILSTVEKAAGSS